ncbi:hypothetical protein SAY86_000374 [Trapa natans]|uniref:3,4-dihydroxy-2-butanone-4-phosphate synthase n=1 Tax=Trapa natans TaxID=22666 RepID=A0AAN7RLD0_TRANT|nr:hypothetical protein SAY86_000374 [Trapa natans]
MARLPKLREFAERESLKIVCIADLIRYRRKRTRLVGFPSAARLPTMWGEFKAYCYKSVLDGMEHVAMVMVKAQGPRPGGYREGAACSSDQQGEPEILGGQASKDGSCVWVASEEPLQTSH